MQSQTIRVVSWNCNGAFRNKFELLEPLQADLLIVQEAENPDKWGGNYKNWATSFLWRGASQNKGLAVFARNGLTLKALDWPHDGRQIFLPCRVENAFNLIGVWTKQNKGIGNPYIGQFWHYLKTNKQYFSSYPTAAIGDFNSNSRWDRPRRIWNHGDVVDVLRQLDIHSLYHSEHELAHGSETEATLYLLRNLNKAFHIDFAFAHRDLTPEIIDFSIGKPELWLKHSDHMPITFNLKVP